MDVRVGSYRGLSAEELMLSKCCLFSSLLQIVVNLELSSKEKKRSNKVVKQCLKMAMWLI